MGRQTTFFDALEAVSGFGDVLEPRAYVSAPSDWVVMITDIMGSTKAIEAGRYKEVNLLGVASIAAVLNACKGIDIPFIFGGDGATFLLPPSQLDAAKRALFDLAAMAMQLFELELRVGAVPVQVLIAGGHSVLVAKFAASPDVTLAMFSGDGWSEADRQIKAPGSEYRFANPTEPTGDADYTGLQCRWRPIPARHGNVVSLLVVAAHESSESAVCREVWELLVELGDEQEMRPASAATLRMSTKPDDLVAEARIATRAASGPAVDRYAKKATRLSRVASIFRKLHLKMGSFDANAYVRATVANTDFRKFDGTLRLIIDIDDNQLERLRSYLDERHRAGELFYGLHTQDSALMTCLVGDFESNHVHFVDGAGGGYTMAAVQLKKQLAAARQAATASAG